MLRFDHLVIAANTLAEGLVYAKDALGLAIPSGGAHPLMGTHNHLLRLGPASFLEVIAPDPSAAPPQRARWFALDNPRTQALLSSSPRLLTWVANTDDLGAALSAVPHAAGPAITVTRGTLTWRIGVPPDGAMPLDGAFPTLIQWPEGPHPASRMADLGCSLLELEIRHPEAQTIEASLAPLLRDRRIRFSVAPKPSLRALIQTPDGTRQLV